MGVKGTGPSMTETERSESLQKGLSSCRRTASRWRLCDSYLRRAGSLTNLIPVLAVSSRHGQKSHMHMCVRVCGLRVVFMCQAIVQLPLFSPDVVFITFPIY